MTINIKILIILALLSSVVQADDTEKKIVKQDGIEVYVEMNRDDNSTDSDYDDDEEHVWDVTEDYNLSAESDFYLDAALVDYSELTDCEEDAKDQMADEAMATVDLCPTRNIDIRLGNPIEIKKIKVLSRKLSNEECQLEATYTLSTLPPEEMKEIDAVCQDEYDGYGASLMLKDGLWQGLQLSLGLGYSGGGIGTFNVDLPGFPSQVEYKYYSAPMVTTDAAYLYKIPVPNMYVLVGTELGWIFEQTNEYTPNLAKMPLDDGGSPYIFRFGLYGGLGYRFFMKYDIQAHMGYQFQYLHRTINGFPSKGVTTTFDGFENNLLFALRGAYHFHENFAVWVKGEHNTVAVTGTFGLTYEFWD